MPYCEDCNLLAPDHARFCPRCHKAFSSASESSMNVRSAPPEETFLDIPSPVKRQQTRSIVPGGAPPGALSAEEGYRALQKHAHKHGCTSNCLIVAAIGTVIAIGAAIVFAIAPPFKPTPPIPTLKLIGNPVPAALLTLHGSNFPPRSNVRITVDDGPL